MKKRIISILLATVLLLSLLPVSSFAEDLQQSDEPQTEPIPALSANRLEATYGTVTVDGTPEAAMTVGTALQVDGYTSVGATWNERTGLFYLGALSEKVVLDGHGRVSSRTNYPLTSIKIEIGEYEYSLTGGTLSTPAEDGLIGSNALSLDGSFAELAIPMKAFVAYQNADGTVYAFVKITVVTNEATEVFDGCVVFSLYETVCNSTMAGFSGALAEKNDSGAYTRISDSAYGMDSALINDIDNGILTYAANPTITANGLCRFKLIGYKASDALTDGTMYNVSFDFSMGANTPVSAPTQPEVSEKTGGAAPLKTSNNGIRALIFFGVGSGGQTAIGESWRTWGSSQFVFSVYNTENGLVLYYGDAETAVLGSVALGKEAGDDFRLGFLLDPDNTEIEFEILVDGTPVGSITGDKGNVYMLPMYGGTGVALGAGNDKMEAYTERSTITYRNLSISTGIKANVANFVRFAVRELISELDEESSVNTVEKNLQVSHGKITVDGFMGKTITTSDRSQAANYIYEDACLVPSTEIGDNVNIGAVWSKNTGLLYLAGFTKNSYVVMLKLEIGGKTFELTPKSESVDGIEEFAFDENECVFEISIPLNSLELQTLGDTVCAAMKITVHTMLGSDCLSGLMNFTADEFFASHTATKAGFQGFVRNEYSNMHWSNNKGSVIQKAIPGGAEFQIKGSSQNDLSCNSTLIYNGLTSWTACTNVYAEMDLNVMELPVGEPQAHEVLTFDSENSARIHLMLGKGIYGNYPAETLLLVIYNTGEDGLMVIRDNNKDVPDSANRMLLEKKEGEAFKFGIRWYEDNSVIIYVDGVAVGMFGATAAVKERTWSNAGYGLYFGVHGGTSMLSDAVEETVHVKLSNMSFARAFDFDSEFFMAVADGNTVVDKTPGGVDNTPQSTPSNPSSKPNDSQSSQKNPNADDTTESTDTSDVNTDSSKNTKQKWSLGCKGSVGLSAELLLVCLCVTLLLLATKKRSKGNANASSKF